MGTGTAVADLTTDATKALLTAAKMNLKLETVVNADVEAAAAIAWSKMAALASAHILVGSGTNVPTDVAVTGDISIDNAGLTAIAGGVIVNADVNASAAIAWSKMAALTSAHLLVGSGTNVATDVAVTGDISIDNAGLTAIVAGVIVNADVNASAAIAWSKMAALASAHILVGSAANVATDVAMSGDVAIDNAGATTIQANAATIAKVEAALRDETIGAFTMSFETGEYPVVLRIFTHHKLTVNKMRAHVYKVLGATDAATLTLANSAGAMANGAMTLPLSSAIDTAFSVSPTTNNEIAADSYIQITSAKTTAGGKVLVTLEVTRTA